MGQRPGPYDRPMGGRSGYGGPGPMRGDMYDRSRRNSAYGGGKIKFFKSATSNDCLTEMLCVNRHDFLLCLFFPMLIHLGFVPNEWVIMIVLTWSYPGITVH